MRSLGDPWKYMPMSFAAGLYDPVRLITFVKVFHIAHTHKWLSENSLQSKLDFTNLIKMSFSFPNLLFGFLAETLSRPQSSWMNVG
jgi:hypothetical protein